jgi:hypothetical protein
LVESESLIAVSLIGDGAGPRHPPAIVARPQSTLAQPNSKSRVQFAPRTASTPIPARKDASDREARHFGRPGHPDAN